MTDLYCVFGNPISHSKSPAIHMAFAALTAQDMRYEKRLAPIGDFPAALHAFLEEGGRGCNITLPFKEIAWQLAPVRSARAEQAGAINTLVLGKDARLYGDNTDGIGLVRDLHQNAGWLLTGQRILVLGAGGAVRGVLGALLAEHPARVVVANRSPEKAAQLAALFAHDGPIQSSTYADVQGQTFDLIINGTSASLQGELPPLPATLFNANTYVYDMMYAAAPTVFLHHAKAAGAITRDGLGMLVEQAAEAFFLWRNVRPPTANVLAELRATLMAD